MLPSENRIKSHEFKKVLEKGNLFQDKDFSVCVFARGDDNKSKFGVVVSKKISAIAVHRNRVKRAVYETARRNLDRVPKGLDLVFLPKKSVARRTTEEIMKQVENFLKRKFT